MAGMVAVRAIGAIGGLVLALLGGAAAAQAPAMPAALPPPLPPETSDMKMLAPAGPHRLILAGMFGGAGGQVIDGDSGDLQATISMADLSNIAVAPDGSSFYVAETIWSKGNRGTRQDMVSVYDGTTLALKREIALPGRAYMVPRRENFALSTDGRRAYVYDLDPSSSVIVVDLARARVATVAETPGCGLIFPWGTDGFSSICGDGSIAAVSLAGGKPVLKRTASFFDPETDPVFEQSPSDPVAGRALFISYTGRVYPARLGPETVLDPSWSIQAAAGLAAPGTGGDELAWRPGGREPFAYHKASGRLFVLMHAGVHWTQKEPAAEVWVLDVNRRVLLKRFALEDPVESIAVSQDADPLLYTVGKDETLRILSTSDFGELKKVPKVGQVIPLVPDA